MIYSYAFPTNETICPPPALSMEPNGTQTVLALGRTCRKIRAEVIPMYFASNMFTFPYAHQMYKFMARIGREGRQALRQVEFVWDFTNSKYHLSSQLRDCTQLQRLHIGFHYWITGDLQEFNEFKSRYQQKDLWEWEGQGEKVWEVISRQPDGLELKIREEYYHHCPYQRTTIFEVPASGAVEEFEAELKEGLRRLGRGKRRAAVEGWIKQRRARQHR